MSEALRRQGKLAKAVAVSRRADVPFDWTILARVLVATCVTAGLLRLCAPCGAWLIPTNIGGALTYAILLRALRVIRRDDIDLALFWRGRGC